MRALVTGGAGFIGSHLVEALVRRGADVVVLDNLCSGSRANLRAPGLAGQVEFVQADVTDAAAVRRAMAGCDWVFHQAALVSVPKSVEYPRESHRDNVVGTLEVLTAARDAGVRRVVLASSSAVYGDRAEVTKREDLPPLPLTPYALQKYAAERYGQLFHALYGLQTVGLRYFNVFGPRQAADSPYSGVIARFCAAFLANQRPTVFGDGRQSRDFVYVANVVAANLAAAEGAPERVAGRVFNVGTGTSLTLLELIGELQRVTGRALEPQFKPARPGDVRFSNADVTAATRDLGYRVTVSWQDGLAATLDWYRTQPR
ncbi:MAG: SDR family NAD(P)-dependent oxidoreductase [Verrucomicrobia bacterium]|nr:SDR family NAD(P)-dependent oxidoreductase [Verrucomicrobiota bacterium]